MYVDDSKVIAEVNESTLQLDTSEMVDVQQMQNNVLMKWGKMSEKELLHRKRR